MRPHLVLASPRIVMAVWSELHFRYHFRPSRKHARPEINCRRKRSSLVVFPHALLDLAKPREAPVQFGSVTVRGWNGSSGSPAFGSGGSSAKRVFCASAQFRRQDVSGSGFGSWKTVPAVPVPL